jgi:hypothetical protein
LQKIYINISHPQKLYNSPQGIQEYKAVYSNVRKGRVGKGRQNLINVTWAEKWKNAI